MLRRKGNLLFLSIAIMGMILGGTLLRAAIPAVGQSDNGRLNCDEAAPVVLYCDAERLDVYQIDANGAGNLAFTVPVSDLDSAPAGVTSWIAGTDDGLLDVYVLETGEFQVNAANGGELWVGIWQGCPGETAEITVYSRVTGKQLSHEQDSCGQPEAVRTTSGSVSDDPTPTPTPVPIEEPTPTPTPTPVPTEVPMCQAYASSTNPTVVTVPCDQVCVDHNGRNVVCP